MQLLDHVSISTCDGPPGVRPHYHESYYAAFVHDPHGNRIEAVCHVARED